MRFRRGGSGRQYIPPRDWQSTAAFSPAEYELQPLSVPEFNDNPKADIVTRPDMLGMPLETVGTAAA